MLALSLVYASSPGGPSQNSRCPCVYPGYLLIKHFVLPFFSSLTTVQFSNSLVLTTIRIAGVGVGAPLANAARKSQHPKRIRALSERSEPKDLSLTPLISDPRSSTFVPRIRVSQHPDLASGCRTRVRGFFGSSSTFNFELSTVHCALCTACPEVRRRVDVSGISFAFPQLRPAAALLLFP